MRFVPPIVVFHLSLEGAYVPNVVPIQFEIQFLDVLVKADMQTLHH